MLSDHGLVIGSKGFLVKEITPLPTVRIATAAVEKFKQFLTVRPRTVGQQIPKNSWEFL